MVKRESGCVQCPKEMGCLGNLCPRREVITWVCDRCGEENVDLWQFEGEEICKDCLLKAVPMAHRE